MCGSNIDPVNFVYTYDNTKFVIKILIKVKLVSYDFHFVASQLMSSDIIKIHFWELEKALHSTWVSFTRLVFINGLHNSCCLENVITTIPVALETRSIMGRIHCVDSYLREVS